MKGKCSKLKAPQEVTPGDQVTFVAKSLKKTNLIDLIINIPLKGNQTYTNSVTTAAHPMTILKKKLTFTVPNNPRPGEKITVVVTTDSCDDLYEINIANNQSSPSPSPSPSPSH